MARKRYEAGVEHSGATRWLNLFGKDVQPSEFAKIGILISLGVYFAYDWNGLILDFFPGDAHLVFFVPAVFLAIFWLITFVIVRNLILAAIPKRSSRSKAAARWMLQVPMVKWVWFPGEDY